MDLMTQAEALTLAKEMAFSKTTTVRIIDELGALECLKQLTDIRETAKCKEESRDEAEDFWSGGHTYKHYLETEHWMRMREMALSRADYHCSVCGSTSVLQVHHNTYERLFEERLGDLVALCGDCHQLFHRKMQVR